MEKINITELTFEELENFIEELGEKSFMQSKFLNGYIEKR